MEIFAEDIGSVLGINLTFNEMINRYKSYISIHFVCTAEGIVLYTHYDS